uniref:Uncharacterized protein n=1 Tax=Suricata suricatta TaxID=37032 RepID=A0A673TXE1_SURSU
MPKGKGSPSHLYSSRCVVPEAPGRWIKRTGESLVPKALCRNCPADDLLVGSILVVAAKAGGALAVVPRPSSRVDGEEEVGDEAEAGETMKGTFRLCILTAPRKVHHPLGGGQEGLFTGLFNEERPKDAKRP